MVNNAAVTWDELEKYCCNKQETCHALLQAKNENHVLQIEAERRTGMDEFKTALMVMAEEIKGLKKLLEGAWVLPKPVFVLVCLGMIGIGVAGKEFVNLVLKYF